MSKILKIDQKIALIVSDFNIFLELVSCYFFEIRFELKLKLSFRIKINNSFNSLLFFLDFFYKFFNPELKVSSKVSAFEIYILEQCLYDEPKYNTQINTYF
jgi:hypothetical protein